MKDLAPSVVRIFPMASVAPPRGGGAGGGWPPPQCFSECSFRFVQIRCIEEDGGGKLSADSVAYLACIYS